MSENENENQDDMEDLDDDFALDDENLENFDEKKSTLGSFFRENAPIKIGAIIVVLIVIFAFFFTAEEEGRSVSPSVVQTGSEVTTAPGTEGATPAYIEAIEEENERRLEQARMSNESALPTPIDPPVGRVSLPTEEEAEEDPLQRWRRLQEERLEREVQRAEALDVVPIEEQTGRAEAINALAEVMANQMTSILDQQNQQVNRGSLSITSPDYLESLRAQEEEEAEAAAAQTGADQVPPEIIVPAGDVYYAQFLTEANSDVPGPVLAQILSGPLTGKRILGEFEVQDEFLTVTFSTVVIDGVSQGIDAIALDIDTTLPGIATEVDHRYFQRIILPMAAAFVEGAATAIAESGRTTVTIDGETVAEETEEADNEQEIATGVEEAGAELRSILDEQASDIQTLVVIDAGTTFALLFLEPVLEEEDLQARRSLAGGASGLPAGGDVQLPLATFPQ